MSKMPRFEPLSVEPVSSSGLRRRLRAFPARSRASAPISRNDFMSAFRITGVMRPSSMATAMPTCTSFQYRMWSSWNQALQARCCTSARATALMMISLNEIFPPSSPSCLLSASRASAARSMPTSVVRKKCGIGPIEAAKRFAIVLRIWVSGTSSYGTPVRGARSAVRGTACAATVAAGAPSTSRFITRPPGPDPCTSLRSTPASLAIRRASGDAFTRVASAGATAATGCGAGAGFGAALGVGFAGVSRAPLTADRSPFGAGAAAPSPSTFSPGFPIHATIFPTGTVVPSGTITFNSCPSARATSSMTALSVSTSASVSPDFTGSPSCLFHFTRRPSSIVGDNASMWTLVAIQVQNLPCRRHNFLGRCLRRALEMLVVGHGHIGLRDTLHRRIEIVECVTLYQIDDLRPDSDVRPPLFDDHRAVRFLDRFENRRLVQRAEGPQIEYFRRNVLLGELIRRFLRHGECLGVADERHIAARTLDFRLADRDDVLPVGYVTLQVIEHLAFEHDDRVVVADRGLQDSLGVGGRGGGDDLESGDVRKPALPCLRVLRGQLQRRPVRPAEDDGDPNLPTRHVQHLGRGIDDLIERQQGKVPGHKLDHRSESTHSGAHANPRESELGDGRIDHALGTELLQQSAAHLVRALIDADFLTHQKHVGVALHLLAERLVQGIAIGQGGHGQSANTSRYSASGSGSGLSSANLTASSTSAWISASIASSAA